MAEAMGTREATTEQTTVSVYGRPRDRDRSNLCPLPLSVRVESTSDFRRPVGLTAEQVASLTHGGSSDPCWSSRKDRVLIEVADALHDGLASMTSCRRASLSS